MPMSYFNDFECIGLLAAILEPSHPEIYIISHSFVSTMLTHVCNINDIELFQKRDWIFGLLFNR